MKRIAPRLALGVMVLSMLGGGGLLTLNSFNQFDPLRSNFDGSCEPVAGIAGPADLQIDPFTHLAFVSSRNRDAGEKGRGAIHALSIDDPLAEDAWRDRTGGVPELFAPEGVYFYSDGHVRRLFVVNAAANAIELYDVALNGDLTHLESFHERRLTNPNDVVAVGPRAFYVSNDFSVSRDSFLARIEFVTRAATGKLFYFDGGVWKVAAEDLRFASGVNVSPDGRRIYVAETSGGALKIFDREPESGLLALAETVPMDAAVDSINIDRAGTLWIAAHPKPLLLALQKGDSRSRPPSLVIRYDDMPGARGKPAEVYANDGAELSASSSAARLGSTLLIGALYEKKFLICRLAD